MDNNKRNILLATLIVVGIGVGIGVTGLLKIGENQAMPSSYEPTANQDAQDEEASDEMQANGVENLPDTQPDLKEGPQETQEQKRQMSANKRDEIFTQQNGLVRFGAFPAEVYRGEWVSMGDECVNCEGGPQNALKKQSVDFAGSYALYTLAQGDNQTIVGAVNVQNGEVIEFPAMYKEVGAPFDLRTSSRANSNLVWIQGVDANNPDIYRIDAFVLKNGEIERIQGFEISFLSQIFAPNSLELEQPLGNNF